MDLNAHLIQANVPFLLWLDVFMKRFKIGLQIRSTNM